jgi:hypothetical protein
MPHVAMNATLSEQLKDNEQVNVCKDERKSKFFRSMRFINPYDVSGDQRMRVTKLI